MNKQNAASQSSMLREMVKVKKLHFGVTENIESVSKLTRDAIQRRANFQEFRSVYGDSLEKKSSNALAKRSFSLHKTKSGSLYKFPKVKKEPQYVETINIELPLHYGADRAVHQLPENKIKPKKSNLKVNREVTTENIIEKLKSIEEVNEKQESIADLTEKSIDEIQKQLKARKETMWKNLPRVAMPKSRRKHSARDKIMTELANINEKLEKMHKKYYDQPRVQYRSVNNCFTQSGNIEVIYENEKYPEEVKLDSDIVKISGDAINEDNKEMNEMFPEFPKIEDTLREIEVHLDNIVNLEDSETIKTVSATKADGETEDNLKNYCGGSGGANLAAILAALEKQYSPLEHTNRILKDLDRARDDKLRTIRKQIEVVEEFCDRMSEIANNESDTESISTVFTEPDPKLGGKEEKNYLNSSIEGQNMENEVSGNDKGIEEENILDEERRLYSKSGNVSDFMEGPDLQASIKKSNYLSKEFGNFEGYSSQPIIKVFSENDQRNLWRKKMRSMEQMKDTHFNDGDSVTKMIDHLKFSLENSLYEVVA